MRFLFVAAAMLWSLPAAADEWHEAETTHFRILSSGEEKDLVKFAERLEQFHTLLRLATGANDADLEVVKVKVVMVPSVSEAERLSGILNRDVAGFYLPREEGAIAVVPRVTQNAIFSGQLVLFHEYAHHFMLQYSPVAYPAWYVEGFAEITSTASFERPGAITYGKAASHRTYELFNKRYSTANMVDGSYLKEQDGRPWSYGDAWLVTHYLTFADKRKGQLRAYLDAINSGQSMKQAATAFGDLSELQREVSIYFAGRSFPYRAVPLPANAAGAIRVRAVPADEAALIESEIELTRRLRLPAKSDDDADDDENTGKPDDGSFAARLAEAKERRDQWIGQLEAKASATPGSVYGWRLLADARCGARQYQACLTAAERALTIAPTDSRATVRRAEALMYLAAELPAEQRKAQVGQARTIAAKVMNAQTDDPVSRIVFYKSYAAEGRKASPVGIKALVEAVRLVPQLNGPRLTLARELANLGETDAAKMLLRPLAYAPHGGAASARARKMLAKLDEAPGTATSEPEKAGGT